MCSTVVWSDGLPSEGGDLVGRYCSLCCSKGSGVRRYMSGLSEVG